MLHAESPAAYFKDISVKTIRKKDLRAFAESLTKEKRGKDGRKIKVPLADKSKANYLSQLHDFYYGILIRGRGTFDSGRFTQIP